MQPVTPSSFFFSTTPKMGGVSSSEMLVTDYHLTWCHVPEGPSPHQQRCENLVSHSFICSMIPECTAYLFNMGFVHNLTSVAFHWFIRNVIERMPCFHIAVPDLTSGHYKLFSTCKSAHMRVVCEHVHACGFPPLEIVLQEQKLFKYIYIYIYIYFFF